MNTALSIVYLANAIIVIVLILTQGRGAGLGSAWGGGGELFSTRRGVERITFASTIVAVAMFFILSVVGLVL